MHYLDNMSDHMTENAAASPDSMKRICVSEWKLPFTSLACVKFSSVNTEDNVAVDQSGRVQIIPHRNKEKYQRWMLLVIKAEVLL